MTAINAERCAADEVVGGKHSYSIRNVVRFADPVHQVQASQAACIVDPVFGVQGCIDNARCNR
jgi:hypothetical protein